MLPHYRATASLNLLLVSGKVKRNKIKYSGNTSQKKFSDGG